MLTSPFLPCKTVIFWHNQYTSCDFPVMWHIATVLYHFRTFQDFKKIYLKWIPWINKMQIHPEWNELAWHNKIEALHNVPSITLAEKVVSLYDSGECTSLSSVLLYQCADSWSDYWSQSIYVTCVVQPFLLSDVLLGTSKSSLILSHCHLEAEMMVFMLLPSSSRNDCFQAAI